jgi:hypothetical protein
LSRIAFLDFEASSLAKTSYPIEVAWVFPDGASESFLIRPAPGWTDWAPEAEAVHGLARERVVREGVAHDWVALHMLTALRDVTLYASAPSWDGQWLSRLLRAAGLPRHALRLKATAEAQRRVILDVLAAGGVAPTPRDALAGKLLATLRRVARSLPARASRGVGATPPAARTSRITRRCASAVAFSRRAWRGRPAARRSRLSHCPSQEGAEA